MHFIPKSHTTHTITRFLMSKICYDVIGCKNQINFCTTEEGKGVFYMKKFYSFMTRFGGMVAAFAMVVTSLTANSTCIWLSYQPEEPEEVKALKKN